MKSFFYSFLVIAMLGTLLPVGLYLFKKGSIEINNISNVAIEKPKSRQTSRMEAIQYYKDERTNLCFAYLEDIHGTVTLTGLAHIPCETLEEVILFESRGVQYAP